MFPTIGNERCCCHNQHSKKQKQIHLSGISLRRKLSQQKRRVQNRNGPTPVSILDAQEVDWWQYKLAPRLQGKYGGHQWNPQSSKMKKYQVQMQSCSLKNSASCPYLEHSLLLYSFFLETKDESERDEKTKKEKSDGKCGRNSGCAIYLAAY